MVPVFRKIPADLATPVSAFLQLDDGRYSFLLESVEGGEKVGRYSFIGAGPFLVFESLGTTVTLTHPARRDQRNYTTADPFPELEKLFRQFRPVQSGVPRFSGGAVGFIGYDMVRFFEKLPDHSAYPVYSRTALLCSSTPWWPLIMSTIPCW